MRMEKAKEITLETMNLFPNSNPSENEEESRV